MAESQCLAFAQTPFPSSRTSGAWRSLRRLIILACLVPLWISNAAEGGLSKDRMNQTIEEFNEIERSGRRDRVLLPRTYVEFQGQAFACVLPTRFLRLVESGQTFTIRKAKVKETSVELRLRSNTDAEVRIWVSGHAPFQQADLDTVVALALNEVFDFHALTTADRFVANTKSGMLHFAGCNHLPDHSLRLSFPSREAGLDAGFRPCSVCFAVENLLPIEGYGPSRVAALEQSRYLELIYPPVEDDDAHQRLEQLGLRMLSLLPFEPAGYDYRFRVLRGDVPNAMSIPTGFVYVTDQLANSIEDSLELAYVLGHELAHVEWPRELPTLSSYTLRADVESALQFRLRLSRWSEMEKDALSLMTLRRATDHPAAVERARPVMDKLVFAGETAPGMETDVSSHPRFAERRALFEPSSFLFAQQSPTFCGFRKDGEPLVRAMVVGEYHLLGSGNVADSPIVVTSARSAPLNDARHFLFVFLEISDVVNEPVDAGRGSAKDEAGTGIDFASDLFPFELSPGSSGIVPFAVTGGKGSINNLQELSLDLVSEVKSWERCTDGDAQRAR